MGARYYTRRELMAEHYVGKAPDGYEWCDYIQNTSSAYINTGCYPDGNSTYVELVMANVTNTSYRGVIGVTDSGSARWGIGQHASSGTTARFGFGGTNVNIGTIATTKTTIIIDKNVVTRADTKYTNSGTWSGGATSNPMCVFRMYAGATNCALMKLYSLKITIGGVLLRDYAPIKRLSDNKYGLWDRVNKNFVTSASSSNFTGGND